MRDSQLYQAARSAFEAARFVPSFGRAYLDLSEAELNEVHAAFLRCFRDWRSTNLSAAFLPSRMTQAVLWRREVGTGPKAEIAKEVEGESRQSGSKFLLQSKDVLVYGRKCGVVNSGVRLIETPVAKTTIDLVFRKDSTYRMVPSNPDFRVWFESVAMPAISSYCPTTRDIYVNSFAVGVHIDATSLAERPSTTGSNERPINTFAFNRAGGAPQYRMVGPVDESLDAVRALRGKIVAAEEARNADYQAGVKAARDAMLTGREGRANLRASTLAALERDKGTAGPASKWLTSLLLTHGSTRGEILKNLGLVKLSDSSEPRVTAILSREEQRAAIRAAAEQMGLKIDANAAATLVVRLESASATAKFDAGVQHLEVPIAGVWSKAWIEAPATVLREHGFVRTSVTLANGMDAHLVARSGFEANSVRSVIAKSIAQLKDEAAANTKPFLTDDDWLDLLIPHLWEANQLYQSFQQSAALSHNGAEPLLAGIGTCCDVTTGVSKFNNYGLLEIGKNIANALSGVPSNIRTGLPNGDELWNPIPIWEAALAGQGIRNAERRYVEGYVPFLHQDLLGDGQQLASYRNSTYYGSVVTSFSYLRESNCIVSSGGMLVRSWCEVAFPSSGEIGLGAAELMTKISKDGAAGAASAIARDHRKLALNTAVLFPVPPPGPRPPAPVKPVITGPPGSLISSQDLSVLYLIQREARDPAAVSRYRNELLLGVERLWVLECKYVPRSGPADQPEVHYFWHGESADLSKISADNPARIHLLHIPAVGTAPPSLDEIDRLARPRN